MEPLHAGRFEPIDGPLAERWAKFPKGWDRPYLPTRVGLELEDRSIVFCRAEVRTDDGKLAADGTLTYTVRPPRS